jgi:hypothetical protein
VTSQRHRLCTCDAEPDTNGLIWHTQDCLWTRAFGHPEILAIASGLKGAFA